MDKTPFNCEEVEVRKGPWTMEEDYILVNYIANHGEGVWNTVAKEAGLKRTGKSCRLRWLNYLRPDIRRGNITPEEELLIMELHAKWGNRWSRIAKHLPGRTDNEIKNYWRTRIQKHIKQADHHQAYNTTTTTSSNTGQQIGSTNDIHAQLQAETSSHHHHHHQAACLLDHGIDTFSPPPSFNRNVDNSYPINLPVEPNETYWNMEDIWSIDLPHGD